MSPRRKRDSVVVRDVLLRATYKLGEGVPADTAVQACLDDLLSSNATQDGADPLHGLPVVRIETATERAPNEDPGRTTFRRGRWLGMARERTDAGITGR